MSSESEISVRVENLSKCFRIGLKEEIPDTFGKAAFAFLTSPLKNFRRYRSLYTFDDLPAGDPKDSRHLCGDVLWALRDVSFEVRHGEVLGIIGKNGAGKSTLLKILSKITEPTSGRAEIRGKVSSLLEVGTGFHPELTGRDNVYLNGTILGMRKREIDQKFDEIVDFSGIEPFIDTPVKRYSSGMKVRLAFAVAAHLEPDILVIDEVLAVGDAEFQRKCLGKMHDVTTRGRTVLFVSHNMGAVVNLCSRAVILEHGLTADTGPASEVVPRYLAKFFDHDNALDLSTVSSRYGDGRLRFKKVFVRNENGAPTSSPISGHPIDIVLDFESRHDLPKVQFILTIFNQLGIAVGNCNVDVEGHWFPVKSGPGRMVCRIPRLPLPLGTYRIAVAAHDAQGDLDGISTACTFDVESSNFFRHTFSPPMRYSTVLLDHEWHNEPNQAEIRQPLCPDSTRSQ